MRYSLIVLAAALATTFGCQQRQAPQVSETEITSAEMPRSEPRHTLVPSEPTTLEEFRANARRDMMNLDQRIRAVESRSLGTKAPYQARKEISEARTKHESLARAIDELDEASWRDKLAELELQWEDTSSITDSASAKVTDEAR